MSRRRPLSDSDADLWRHATRDVTPMAQMQSPPESLPPRRRKIRPQMPGLSASPRAQTSLPPLTQPFNRSWKRQVSRGEIEIAAVLDLHGMTELAAHQRLARFIATRSTETDRVVLVITGKGRGGEGLLRRRLADWLTAPEFAGRVAGFFPAHLRHGGSGAFYVVLRRQRGARETGS